MSTDSVSPEPPTATLEEDGPPDWGVGPDLASGSRVGRYFILGRLGAGGMGVVYAAYDPELDRKIAIKLLHRHERESFDSTADPAQRRLLREAQAMARLDHVNVVSVHDVGEFSGGVYVAMEFIDGETLASKLARERPAWKEVLELFTEAASGLAAAHRKGLVHRDFKPDNVMVGQDGRVRVMDFGLAREVEKDENPPAEVSVESLSGRRELATPLTEVGSLMGTPAYMAPEQHMQEEVGPASDQFSFCVALWQAVYGRHPFGGDSRIELVMRVVRGDVLDPGTTSLPSWLHRVLERGLSREPADRFESMDALQDAVAHGLRRSRRRPLWAGLGVLVAVGAGGIVSERAGAQQREVSCAEAGREILQTWSPQARASLTANASAVDVSYAADTAQRTVSQLDAWVEKWSSHREESCRADRVRGEVEPRLAERAAACFEERRVQLEVLLEGLAEMDASVARELVSVTARLPRIESCVDAAALRRWPEEPSDQREAFRSLRRDLSEVEALRLTLRLEEAELQARRVVDTAETLGNPAYVARARLVLGEIAFRRGDYETAEELLRIAFREAGAIDELETAATAAGDLTYVVGYLGARPGEGLVWSDAHRVFVERIESEPGLWTSVWASQRGTAHLKAGDYDEAVDLMTRALSLQQAELGPDHPKAISTLNNVAALTRQQGHVERAVELQRGALAATEGAWGADHPKTAAAYGNLGAFLRDAAEFEESEASLLRAIDIVTEAHGELHPSLASHITNIAVLYYRQDRLAEAEAMHERTLAIARAAHGEQHPLVAKGLLNLALVTRAKGELERADSLAKQGAAAMVALVGPTHEDSLQAYRLRALVLTDLLRFDDARVQVQSLIDGAKSSGTDTLGEADGVSILGSIEARTGNPELAREAFEKALAILDRADQEASRHGARAWLGLAELSLQEGETAAALEFAEHGLARVVSGQTSVQMEARAKFLVARALQSDSPGPTPKRALVLAREAAAMLRNRPANGLRTAVEDWLVARTNGL